MTDKIVVAELSPTASETEALLFALDRSRMQFAWKTGGLDAAGLSRTHPPSTMTLGGLIKHLALIEDYYTSKWVTGEQMGAPWDQADFDADPDWEWRTGAQDSPEELYALWFGAVRRTQKALASIRPEEPSLKGANFRRLLVDLHDEYARHTGHADLLREAVDGLVGEDPPRDS
ncbi:DUF664 domain-containing protein [Actinoplanes sp. NBRC 103695]|uniref:mycothiol transferase n=1 Tax=Actinoplanes sp. NBRC 103695 TaxID=3032202 RepID=UPI0024A3AB21|nr:DUF664 domain-containing protein [Actinoplanes sp. NBRC 103695]GLZ02234.1 mini-circle protein [Actinoplanes sp. NBRC 103695]